MTDQSPSRADQLLRKIQHEERLAAKGRLKVFLGYAPRVGKSERLFEEGSRRAARGQDVVIGAVQDGWRPVEVSNNQLEEVMMTASGDVDVAGIIRRRPDVCLIDELAHKNRELPNRYRWEDVRTIMQSGIHVVTAVNLQHILEQQDAVFQITRKRAVTTVPAEFVRDADELVIVDAPLSTENWPGGLSAGSLGELRELALLFAAEVVEMQLQRYMDAHGIRPEWSAQERILVCITPRSSAKAMIDSAVRVSARFHGQMFALCIRQPDLRPEEEEILAKNLEYARTMGAQVAVEQNVGAAEGILRFAQNERITQLFIGHTQRRRWTVWHRSPIDTLLSEADGIDIRLFPQEAVTGDARPA